MRIIFVEDDKDAKELAGSLTGKGHDVQWCQNVADAEWYIDRQGSEKPFDAIILDINLGAGFLDERWKDECLQKSAGWVFYERVLKEINPKLYERVIFYTGYPDVFRHDAGERADVLRFVDKSDANASRKIDEMLAEIFKLK